jgi:hypothetical protein
VTRVRPHVRSEASLLAFAVALLVPATALADRTVVALTAEGLLALFAAERPGEARLVPLAGASARLVGLDTRQADGRLYGLAASNDLYRVDPASGRCTLVSTLTVPFDGDVRSGMDFNPQADRLRLVSIDGRNLRVHVALGATAADAPLAYGRDDPNAGRRPRVVAAAYTNAVPDAITTRLFVIDAELDVLALQDPPNDGVLATVGPLGVDFAPLAGFDVATEGGVDRAWAASGGVLYRVDLESGRAAPVGPIGDGTAAVVSLAVVPGAPP